MDLGLRVAGLVGHGARSLRVDWPCCALIGPALWGGEGFETLDRPEGPINFYGVFAIHADEMEFKPARGADALGERFDRAGVSELLVPDRPSALRRRKRFGIF
jgi:suppressor of fused protein SUFU